MSSNVTPTVNIFNQQDYPLKLNNQWRYKVTDYYFNTVDTLVIKITNQIILSDSETDSYCLLYIDTSVVDSGIFKQIGERLSYDGLNQDYSYFGNFVISFPVALNSSWLGFYAEDTVKLVSIDSNVIVNSFKYNNIFYVKRSFYLIGNYSLVQSLELGKKIGIITQSLYIANGGFIQNQNFELIDYTVN